ncbi:hypothetical protein TKK_0018453 [Trichogramma kaykai]|uniref:Elongator complex protein 4 n=1 Tax=Trichogramma kaykai TaxID=54128 RepID=A0ABD2VY00_9HYME
MATAPNVTVPKSQIRAIPGTKPATRNAQLLVSSGIPSLDHFIGGGVPIGSILLVEEDPYNTYAKVIYKYFIAEGIECTHSVFVASQDAKPEQILKELPAVVKEDEPKHRPKVPSAKDDEMIIAWRYQNMKIVDSSPGDKSIFGHYYDLTKNISKEALEKANITTWNGENIQCQNSLFENAAYYDLLLSIDKTIQKGNFSISQTASERNILRIAIQCIGSRMWMSDTEEKTSKDLVKFVYMLRALLRESYAVVILTIPPLNYEETTTVQRVEHLSDIVVDLESFAGSAKETNPVFKDYHGLLNVKKLPAFNTLVSQESLYSDLAFKLRRKKFLIEILHLPPELGETTQREQDDLGCCSSTGRGGGCSSGSRGQSKLDF